MTKKYEFPLDPKQRWIEIDVVSLFDNRFDTKTVRLSLLVIAVIASFGYWLWPVASRELAYNFFCNLQKFEYVFATSILVAFIAYGLRDSVINKEKPWMRLKIFFQIPGETRPQVLMRFKPGRDLFYAVVCTSSRVRAIFNALASRKIQVGLIGNKYSLPDELTDVDANHLIDHIMEHAIRLYILGDFAIESSAGATKLNARRSFRFAIELLRKPLSAYLLLILVIALSALLVGKLPLPMVAAFAMLGAILSLWMVRTFVSNIQAFDQWAIRYAVNNSYVPIFCLRRSPVSQEDLEDEGKEKGQREKQEGEASGGTRNQNMIYTKLMASPVTRWRELAQLPANTADYNSIADIYFPDFDKIVNIVTAALFTMLLTFLRVLS